MMLLATNLARLRPYWRSFDRAIESNAFNEVEAELGFALPPDYKAFLLWSNGGQTQEPLTTIRMYPLEELLARRSDGQPPETLEVGTDFSQGFALDFSVTDRAPDYPIVAFPLGDTTREETETVALNINEFIGSWFTQPPDRRSRA